MKIKSIILEKDKWGQSVLAIDCEYKENEKNAIDMMNDAAEMLEASGIKNVKTLIMNVIQEWLFMKWRPEWVMILKILF
jgi:hypothetical protein